MQHNNMVLTFFTVFIFYFSLHLIVESFGLSSLYAPSYLLLPDLLLLFIAYRYWHTSSVYLFPLLACGLGLALWCFALPFEVLGQLLVHLVLTGFVYSFLRHIQVIRVQRKGIKIQALAYTFMGATFVLFGSSMAWCLETLFSMDRIQVFAHFLQVSAVLIFSTEAILVEKQPQFLWNKALLSYMAISCASLLIIFISPSSYFFTGLLLFISSRLLLNTKQFASYALFIVSQFVLVVCSISYLNLQELTLSNATELLVAVCFALFLLQTLLENKRFKHSFEYSQTILVTIDEQGRMVHASKGFLEVMNCTFDEIKGQLLSSYMSEESANQLQKSAAQGESHFCLPEIRLETFNQRTLSLSLFADVVDDKKKHVQTIISLQDISDKLMLTQALSEEKELLEVTLSSIGDGVICTDRQSRITYMNPVAEAVLAKLTKEVKGKPFSKVMSLFNEETLEPIERVAENCMVQSTTLGLPELTCIRNHLGIVFAIQDSISPIYSKKGRVIGSVMVFQDVTESRMISKRMNYLAHHDSLTGLPNRLLLLDRLNQACKRADRNEYSFAVIFIDLDKFKNINDSLGHDAGDVLLKEVSHRLHCGLRSCDTVARMGGDEFVILVDSIIERAHIYTVIEKVLKTCSGEYELKGIQLNITLSAGIAVYPGDGATPEFLMKHADTAMYRAKKVNKSSYQFYNSKLDKEVEQKIEREAELVQGLKKGQFEPYFQAIVNSKSFALEKLEMLARWRQGNVVKGPHEFIGLAEEAGLMNEVTLQLLDKAMLSLVRWVTVSSNLQLSVNLTADQIIDDEFFNDFETLLKHYQISAKNIELEITETSLVANLDEMRDALVLLQDKGFSIAIDDFGTGYSSLTYLKYLKFNTLKIDKKFVDDLNFNGKEGDLAVVIINMAKSLGVSTVAEGVEYSEQAQRLAEAGCSQLQGYFFAKPMPIEGIGRMVELGTVISQIHKKLT